MRLSIQCSIVLYVRHGPSNGAGRRGRSRDPGIDARLLDAAYRHLSVNGFEALSLTGVAREAGTTRQALYRRWPDKASLAAAALGVLLAGCGGDEPISQYTALFSLLGTTYGGNGVTTFALPDLRGLAPNNMTYSICDLGIFPSRR